MSHHADGPCALRVGPVAVRLRATVVQDEVVAEVADHALLNEPLRGGQAQEEERREEGKEILFHFAKSCFRLFEHFELEVFHHWTIIFFRGVCMLPRSTKCEQAHPPPLPRKPKNSSFLGANDRPSVPHSLTTGPSAAAAVRRQWATKGDWGGPILRPESPRRRRREGEEESLI